MSADRSRRAVACPGFHWMERMREEFGATCCRVLDGEPWLWFVGDSVTEHEGEECFPDLTDPATIGCFEHGLLPEAWPDCEIVVRNAGTITITSDNGGGWVVFDVDCSGMDDALAEALVLALEAAPS